MIPEESPLLHARTVKRKYEAELLKKKYVIGVGIGYRRRGGLLTDEVAIIVQVQQKVPRSELAASDLVPETLEGVPVDVEVIGPLRAW